MSILCQMGDLYRTFGELEKLWDYHGFYAAVDNLQTTFFSALISWEPEAALVNDFACHGGQTYILGHCVSGGLDAAYNFFQLQAIAWNMYGKIFENFTIWPNHAQGLLWFAKVCLLSPSNYGGYKP